MYFNAFGQAPTILQSIGELNNFNLENYQEDAQNIASKISDEQIKFEGIIPKEYLFNRNIFESIVAINPQLLENRENRYYLEYFSKGMSDQETIDYYKKLGVPFNSETVLPNNILSVLECLKNDYMTLSDTKKQYTKEEYQKIYELLKDDIESEDILKSRFLTSNPYFLKDLIKSKTDLSNVNFQDTQYYDEFYPELKAVALKNGTDIPEPKDYKEIIRFTNENQIYVNLDSIDSITKGLEYIKNNEFKQELMVLLEHSDNNENVISDNIDFFESLAEKNININFRYKYGNKLFTLEKILDSEHFIQRMVEEIKTKKFSPLEQLIAVYDITKAFKPYKDSEHFCADSRGLYEYLDNEYMVCAGYADLICNLGHRLGAQYTEFSLEMLSGGKTEGHARNYANIVDSKYGIDGIYALEATWEQKGKAGRTSGKSSYEYIRSKYKNFLLTTDESRNVSDEEKINVETYDSYFTAKTPEELRIMINNPSCRNDIYSKIKQLDPEFYKTLEKLNLSKDEDAGVVLDYFRAKINNPVPKENLLDAIINVKKTIYINFNEQDFEDMKMGYSITEPFAISKYNEIGIFTGTESLYGKQYEEYMDRRYNDIKLATVQEATENNPCLRINEVLQRKKQKILKDDKIFSNLSGDSVYIYDENYIDLLKQNSDKIKKLGFKIETDMDFEEDKESLKLKISAPIEGITIEDNMEKLKNQKRNLYIALGLEKEKSQTQILCEQTLTEQCDTIGKKNIQNEIRMQLENEKNQESPII